MRDGAIVDDARLDGKMTVEDLLRRAEVAR
jgi:hypothetical protein